MLSGKATKVADTSAAKGWPNQTSAAAPQPPTFAKAPPKATPYEIVLDWLESHIKTAPPAHHRDLGEYLLEHVGELKGKI